MSDFNLLYSKINRGNVSKNLFRKNFDFEVIWIRGGLLGVRDQIGRVIG